MGVKYRADIDGLRAIAVVPVVLYHFDVAPFSGGFVGVDVFFVISGFLITSLIHQEMQQGRFSIVGFYERRVRRIAPALFLVLAATTVAAFAILLPTDLRAFGSSLISAVGMYSNIHFFHEAGYFALESSRKPLLHTWTLSVEEQFYLGFPILLYALYRLRWKRPIIIGAISFLFAASLIKGSIAVMEGPQWAFFQTQYRLWELMTGAVLALAAIEAPKNRALREALGGAGLILILAPVFFYTHSTPFPGLAAIPPCLGAALIIYSGAGSPSLTQRLLSLTPMVFVGLISYSLYLWHWPIIVFARYIALDEIPPLGTAALISLAFIMAWLSWRYVEAPFRNRARVSRKFIFTAAAGCAITLVGAGTVVAANGFKDRFPPEIAAIDAYKTYDRDAIYRAGHCYLEKENWDGFDKVQCLTPLAGKFNLLVLGDSHAAHYVHGLKIVLGDRFNILQATAECAPTLPQPSTCHGSAEKAVAFVKANRIDAVILSSAWQPHDIDLAALQRMIAALRDAGTRVVVFGPSINYRFSIPSLLSRWERYKGGTFPAEKYRWPDDLAYDQKMAPLMTSAGAQYVSILHSFCQAGKCPIADNHSRLIHFDGSHLTAEGSEAVISALWKNGTLSHALGKQ